ncbi:hypothetical protein MMC31_007745 [Peltigera leucophlebia]|nr:hypothetical protein [Peltigera leucophlebia]
MNQFKDKNGNNQSALSIIQRRFDVLDRRDKSETETGEGEIGEGETGEGEDRRL